MTIICSGVDITFGQKVGSEAHHERVRHHVRRQIRLCVRRGRTDALCVYDGARLVALRQPLSGVHHIVVVGAACSINGHVHHHRSPNRKFSLRFGKEETSTEEKKPCLQGFVPSWSFLTRLRRPYLFPCAGKDRGERGAWGYVWCFLPLNLGGNQCFRRRSTRESPSRASYYAPPDTVCSSAATAPPSSGRTAAENRIYPTPSAGS